MTDLVNQGRAIVDDRPTTVPGIRLVNEVESRSFRAVAEIVLQRPVSESQADALIAAALAAHNASTWGLTQPPEKSPVEAFNAHPKFVRWQLFEIERARAKHGKIVSIHAAYAIILEELDEFWDEVRKQDRSEPLMVEELVQTAAMCQRAVEDLGLEGIYRPR